MVRTVKPAEGELRTERLLLRPPRGVDAQALYAAVDRSRAALMQWMSWCDARYGIKDAQEWIDLSLRDWGEGNWSFVVLDRLTEELVGVCGLDEFRPRDSYCNLGYWIDQGRQGQGFALEAATCVATFGLQQVRIERIEIVVAEGNTASLRVAHKLGATREGVLRRRLRIHGKSHNAVMHSLTASDLGPLSRLSATLGARADSE